MSFTRDFTQTQIGKMTSDTLTNKFTGESNLQLFERLRADVLKGEVFPAVRINELHFYYKGGCIFKFASGSYKRDKNFEKFGALYEHLPPYEKAKKENEEKFKNAAGGEAERQLLDRLYCHTYSPDKKSNVAILYIEVNLGGQKVRKCDLVLLNTQTDEIMFVEGKVFSDSRVNVAISFIPEVILQVNTYTAAIERQREIILEQYARHIEIINGLFGSSFRHPQKLIEPAKLLVYGTPLRPTNNNFYSIDTINASLGANNVFFVKQGERPSTDEIWNSLCK